MMKQMRISYASEQSDSINIVGILSFLQIAKFEFMQMRSNKSKNINIGEKGR